MTTKNEKRLQVYTFEGEDWVIAASPDDALAVYEAATGAENYDDGEWVALPDEKPLTLFGHDPDNEEKRETLTCAGWVKRKGRAYLGSANL